LPSARIQWHYSSKGKATRHGIWLRGFDLLYDKNMRKEKDMAKIILVGLLPPDHPIYKEGWSIAVQPQPKKPAPVKPVAPTPKKPQGKK